MKKILVILVLVIINSAFTSTHAQDDLNIPVFFNMEGDIWRYVPSTGELTQETTWGYNQIPIRSPDGQRFAYLSLAQVGVQVLEQHDYLFDPKPLNIWIWELAANEAYRLVDQPSNTTITFETVNNAIRRTSLAWSPNGNELAWIEYGNPAYNGFALLAYNFSSNTTRLIAGNLPSPFGDGGAIGTQDVKWGLGGVAVRNTSVNPNQNESIWADILYIYDPNTGALLHEKIVGTENTEFMDFLWISSTEIALLYRNGNRALYNLSNDTIGAGIQLQLHGSNSTFPYLELASISSAAQTWSADWSETQLSFSTSEVEGQIAFSPSGQAVVYLSDALYMIGSDGLVQAIPGTEGVATTFPRAVIWGTQTWSYSNEVACFLNPRLKVSEEGAVVPDLGNNILRDKPGKNTDGSREIGSIPPNDVFSVLAGPECVSGYNWWQVNYNGQIGWTAEGENGTYWLEPR